MVNVLANIASILIIVEFVIGNFANVFIALVNCIDLINRQRLSSADGILSALAVSRIGLLWVISINWYFTVLNPDIYRKQTEIIIRIAWAVTNHFSTWLATSLSIFYLLKIANFSNFIFLHLKKRERSVILVIMLGTLMLLFSHLVIASILETMQMNENIGNVTQNTKLKDITNFLNMTAFTLLNSMPFFISLTCVLLLIYSLCKHLRRMRLHCKGSQDPSTKIHVKALQTVISFLLLLAVYFVSLTISGWSSKKSVILLCQAAGLLYPSSHSFVLIWGNRKLKETFVSVLWQARWCLKERKPPSLQINNSDIM
ncbi:taste receptor type 2 member 43-like [Callospermophilus lateralis]|uniref:taste receptor type 2 member 43-like n=1 Tax=Callospermophilus lateralis TaxID=76772 RepID=UPI00403899EC